MPAVKKKLKTKNNFLFWIKFILALIAIISFILAFFLKEIEGFIQDQSFHIRKGDCLHQFYQEEPPYLNKESLRENNYPLCFDHFGLMFSGVSKTALWGAEALSPKKIQDMQKVQNSIHSRPNVEQRDAIPRRMQPTQNDYAYSHYVQADLVSDINKSLKKPTVESQLLFNSIPLVSHSVLKNLKSTEGFIQNVVLNQDINAFVITGPIYTSKKLKVIGKNILVPTALFKAVYFPQHGIIGAYYIPNAYSQRVAVVSVCQIEEMTGINIFPQLTEEQKRNTYRLPVNANNLTLNHKIEYSYWDAESQCAESVLPKDMKALKSHFKFDLK